MSAKSIDPQGNADAETLDLRDHGDARLLLRHTDEQGVMRETPVQAVCCFPWTQRRSFISLRDDKGHELRLIHELDQLPSKVRELIETHLTRRLFIPKITHVASIAEQTELFLWKVDTDAGPRAFLTASNESPRSLGNGRVLIKDVGNDLYLIENPEKLDEKSRRLLWIYLD